MSLDVFLRDPAPLEFEKCKHCDGTGREQLLRDDLYSANITHNLNTMAKAVGIYRHLWRPDELGIEIAGELIEPLRQSLAKLKADPEQYRKYDAPNGWGKYEHLVEFVKKYLQACEQNPEARVSVSR